MRLLSKDGRHVLTDSALSKLLNGTYQGGKPYKKVWQTRYLSTAALARYVYVKVAWTKPGERARGMGSSINRQSRSLRGRSLIAP